MPGHGWKDWRIEKRGRVEYRARDVRACIRPARHIWLGRLVMSRSLSGMQGPVLILLGALCFCTTGYLQAVAPEGATPYVIGCVRMLIGGAALFAWCAVRGRLPRRDGWPKASLALCVLAILGFQLMFFNGVLLAGVAVGTVVSIGVTPLSAAFLAWTFLRERPRTAWYPATAMAVAGLVLIVQDHVDGITPRDQIGGVKQQRLFVPAGSVGQLAAEDHAHRGGVDPVHDH